MNLRARRQFQAIAARNDTTLATVAPGIAAMLCVPRFPARPAVPTILVVPFLAVAP